MAVVHSVELDGSIPIALEVADRLVCAGIGVRGNSVARHEQGNFGRGLFLLLIVDWRHRYFLFFVGFEASGCPNRTSWTPYCDSRSKTVNLKNLCPTPIV